MITDIHPMTPPIQALNIIQHQELIPYEAGEHSLMFHESSRSILPYRNNTTSLALIAKQQRSLMVQSDMDLMIL